MALTQPVPQWAPPFLGNPEAMEALGVKFNPVWLKWFIDLINQITGGGIIDHNGLLNLQGGDATAGEFYHFTLAEHSLLTGTKAANTFLGGPTSGLAATPSFRALTVADGATGLSTYTQGDMLYASAANVLSRLSIGVAGKVLQSSGTGPTWSAMTLPTGAPAVGTYLRGDGTNWITSTLTLPNAATTGDMLYASGASAIGNLAVGAVGKHLRSNGTTPEWSTPTFANTAGAGSFLRGDGTNWLQSTLVLPNALNSGDVLYGSSANNAAGLAIGASGKIFQSTGAFPGWTSFTLPTSVGAIGTILRSDGTNLLTTTLTYPNTLSAGDVFYASSGNVGAGLAIGSAGKLLRSTGSLPAWSTPIFPNTAPGAGTFLRGDGTDWTVSTLTIPNTLTLSQIPYPTSANVLGSSANLTFDGSTLTVTGALTATGLSLLSKAATAQFAAVSVPTATATTLTTLTNAAAVGYVAFYGSATGAVQGAAVVVTTGGTYSIFSVGTPTGAGVVLSMSGDNLQLTQATGSTQSVSGAVLKLAAV